MMKKKIKEVEKPIEKEIVNDVGRPLKFKTAEELQIKIDDYFESCHEEMWKRTYDKESGEPTGWEPILDRHGNIMKQLSKPFTVSGLAIALGTSRRVLIEYEKKGEEFSNTIKKAKALCEQFAEESLFTSKQTAGVIFNLKNNYDWVDKQEVNQTGELTVLTYEDQLKRLLGDPHASSA